MSFSAHVRLSGRKEENIDEKIIFKALAVCQSQIKYIPEGKASLFWMSPKCVEYLEDQRYIPSNLVSSLVDRAVLRYLHDLDILSTILGKLDGLESLEIDEEIGDFISTNDDAFDEKTIWKYQQWWNSKTVTAMFDRIESGSLPISRLKHIPYSCRNVIPDFDKYTRLYEISNLNEIMTYTEWNIIEIASKKRWVIDDLGTMEKMLYRTMENHPYRRYQGLSEVFPMLKDKNAIPSFYEPWIAQFLDDCILSDDNFIIVVLSGSHEPLFMHWFVSGLISSGEWSSVDRELTSKFIELNSGILDDHKLCCHKIFPLLSDIEFVSTYGSSSILSFIDPILMYEPSVIYLLAKPRYGSSQTNSKFMKELVMRGEWSSMDESLTIAVAVNNASPRNELCLHKIFPLLRDKTFVSDWILRDCRILSHVDPLILKERSIMGQICKAIAMSLVKYFKTCKELETKWQSPVDICMITIEMVKRVNSSMTCGCSIECKNELELAACKKHCPLYVDRETYYKDQSDYGGGMWQYHDNDPR